MNYDMQCQLLAEGFKRDQLITEDEKLENELGEKYATGELTEKQIARILNAKTGMGPMLAKNRAYQITKRFESKKNAAVMKANSEKSKAQLVKKVQTAKVAGKNTQRDYQRQWLGYGKSELALPGGRRVTLECARQMMEDGLITEELFTEGVKDVIVKKILPGLMMAGMIAGAGKGIADAANKCYAMQSQVTDAEFNSGVYGFSFKNKYYTYDEKKNTVTIDDGKTRKTRKINRLDRVVPDQGHYSQERYGYMHEDVSLFEEDDEKKEIKKEYKNQIKDKKKSKRRAKARVVGFLAAATGLSTADVLAHISRDPEAAKNFANMETAKSLCRQAQREFASDKLTTNAIVKKIGSKTMEKISKVNTDPLYTEKGYDAISKGAMKGFGAIASRLLRMYNWSDGGSGTAIETLMMREEEEKPNYFNY